MYAAWLLYGYISFIFTLQLIDKHMIVLEEAKSEYNKMKKAMDELRTSEVLVCFIFTSHKSWSFLIATIIVQVDADFKLKDMKKAYKEFEMKEKGYKKRLDELQTAIHKHLEQYVIRLLFWNTVFIILSSYKNVNGCRIQADLVDQEKLQATLTDEHLNAACDLKKACEMVALLEAQLKEMNPNLDSISEYEFFPLFPGYLYFF